MKKIFFILCFCLTVSVIAPSFADIVPLVDAGNSQYNQQENTQPEANYDVGQQLPDPNDEQAVRSYFKKRFEEVSRSFVPADENRDGSVDIIHSPEYYKMREEQSKKGVFQSFYEKAVEALGGKPVEDDDFWREREAQTRQAVIQASQKVYSFAERDVEPQQQIPTVGVTLPNGRRILAPAREHIAYLLTYIDIHANGYLKIEDTITLVANNEKFAYGLTRVFPKYAAKYQRIDFILDSVTVNGTKVPYMAEEIGDNIVIKPKYNQRLEAGVYTYVFNYTINNKLTALEKEQMLDWNLTGRPMDILITSANAIVSVPNGNSFTDIVSLVGRGENVTPVRTNRFDLSQNVVAFSNTTPMLNGESMHVLAIMDNSMFIKGFNKNFSNFLINWGNILYAALGLVAILLSFILSLLGLKKEQKRKKYTPSYNGSLMRSIFVNRYDRTAFVAHILDLFRKNAIDIQQSDNRVYLQKKNTTSVKLLSGERKALKALFHKQGNVIEVNKANNVRFKKAKKFLEKIVSRQIKKYNIFHNIIYVIFSVIMLILTEIFIAFISINFAQMIIILLATTLMYAFYIWILRHKFKHWYVSIPTKVLTLLAMVLIWAFSSIYIGGVCSLLIMVMVAVIFAFTQMFEQKNNFVTEAQGAITQYREYLISNAEAINLSRNFLNQQSNIYALDINECFPVNVSNKSYYRLEDAVALQQRLIDII